VGPQSRSGRGGEEKPGLEPPIIQPGSVGLEISAGGKRTV